MSVITSEAPTTDDIAPDRPRLALAGPVASGVLALLAGAALLAGGASMIPVSSTPAYSARLVATAASRPVVAVRGGTVATVHVRDGDTVEAGQLLVRLDPEVIAERSRLLRIDADHTTRLLMAARRDAGVNLPSAGGELQDTPADAAQSAARTARIAALERDLERLDKRLAETVFDILHMEIHAVADGRVSNVAWLAPGARIAAEATVATIEPNSATVTLDVVAPAHVAAAILPAIGRETPAKNILAHARAFGATMGWPLRARIVGLAPPSAADAAAGDQRTIAAQLIWTQGGNLSLDIKSEAPDDGSISATAVHSDARLPTGVWARIDQEVVLNTPGEADGEIRLWVDGALMINRDGLLFRRDPKTFLNGVAVTVAYAGSRSETASAQPAAIDVSPFEIRWPDPAR